MAIVSGLAFSGIRSLAIGAGYRKLHLGIIIMMHTHLENSKEELHQFWEGRNYQLNYNDDSHTEPFWLNLIREAIWTTRSLLLFLVEQPSQLKYIEWPSFQSTLKTATLTLVLVALLIVALSSVDSALSYLLVLFLRRKA
ncbi:hypothetical protein Sango_0162900 [Sesamum angolense]|uniref:Uncharacterized protein n=1 Tax=Sesamum angolense TaxID=2727404 RepID=A0AAE2C6J6_9LAMI|nr:hypothetical protein Sango_0162900 [Sesamum angolense]